VVSGAYARDPGENNFPEGLHVALAPGHEIARAIRSLRGDLMPWLWSQRRRSAGWNF